MSYINRVIRDEAAKVHEIDGTFYVVSETTYRVHQLVCDDERQAKALARKINDALEDMYVRQMGALYSVLV